MKNAATQKEPDRRSESGMLSIRVPDDKLRIIDAAVDITRKTRTAFIIDTVLERAENIISDQRFFSLNEADSAALQAIFDDPPAPVDELRVLMASKAPWE